MPTRTWQFPAVPDCVTGARRAVTEYASAHAVAEPPLQDLRLALTEAVANAVVHGYRLGQPGTITVVVAIEAAALTVSVTDDGTGMAPRVDSPGLGLGVPLMSTLADAIELRPARGDHGTTVCMRFALTG